MKGKGSHKDHQEHTKNTKKNLFNFGVLGVFLVVFVRTIGKLLSGAAASGYGLLKGKGRVATVGGLVAAGFYLQYRSDKKKEDREEPRRQKYFQQRHGRNWRPHYKPGL